MVSIESDVLLSLSHKPNVSDQVGQGNRIEMVLRKFGCEMRGIEYKDLAFWMSKDVVL